MTPKKEYDPLDDDTSLARPREVKGPEDVDLQAVVVVEGHATAHPLPRTGEVSIGRHLNCTVRIEHRSVSRFHAVIFMGPPMRLLDHYSQNGTLVDDQVVNRGEETPVRVGSTIRVGDAQLVLLRRD